MNAEELKALQAPIKARYRDDPEAARVTLSALGELEQSDIACKVDTARAAVTVGLHPAVGGETADVCSGDMLLEALAACAGVTLKAVATSLEIPIRGGTVSVEGDIDFRGALAVDRDAPVGLTDIRLSFDIDADATPEQLETLFTLTERYCIIYQTLSQAPRMALRHAEDLAKAGASDETPSPEVGHGPSSPGALIERFESAAVVEPPEGEGAAFGAALESLVLDAVIARSVQAEALAPEFALERRTGPPVESARLLQGGPLVLGFPEAPELGRNAWIEELRASLPLLHRSGAVPLLLTGDGAEESRGPAVIGDVETLSDPGDRVARAFGLVLPVGAELALLVRRFRLEASALDPGTAGEIRVPAIYVIDSDRKVLWASFGADGANGPSLDGLEAALQRARDRLLAVAACHAV